MVLFLSFATLALAGMVVASPLKRAPSLVVSLSTGAASVNSVDEISLVTTVENISDQNIKVLKFGSVLDNDLPTNSFAVTYGGQSVPFSGVLLQLSMNHLTADSFITIPAGQSVSVTHINIGPLYKFHEAGTGTFTFTPRQDFQVAGVDIVVSEIAEIVSTGGPSVDIHVGSDVGKRELGMESDLEKRDTVDCSNGTQSSFMSASLSEARALAKIAADYISAYGTGDSLFIAYFGATTSSTPLDNFMSVVNEDSTTLSCSDPSLVCGDDPDIVAYAVAGIEDIYYCPIFYNEVDSTHLCSGTTVASLNIRGGTTLKEVMMALDLTDQTVYGCSNAQNLASSDPASAMINADSYNCFATQVYANTQCSN